LLPYLTEERWRARTSAAAVRFARGYDWQRTAAGVLDTYRDVLTVGAAAQGA
jgi:hypothetical protein